MTNFVCLDCIPSESYSCSQELEAHIASDHLSMNPYECEKCKYAKFPTEFTLTSHYLNDHGITEFSIKYRYTPELGKKKDELADRLQRCVIFSKTGTSAFPEIVSQSEIKLEEPGTPPPPEVMETSPLSLLDTTNFIHYNQVIDELIRNTSTSPNAVDGSDPAAEKKKRPKVYATCTMCNEHVTKQRSSMIYHANTRHGKFDMYECGICHKRWQTIAKSDVLKHIKSHHDRDPNIEDEEMVIDFRKGKMDMLKNIVDKCFPPCPKKFGRHVVPPKRKY